MVAIFVQFADPQTRGAMFEGIARAGMRSPLILQVSNAFGADEEMVSMAARAGCVSAFIGFESISRESLLEANKKNRPHLYRDTIERAHRHGIGISAGIIFGFDHDRPEVFHETVDVLDEMGVDSVRFTALTPMPGTETFAKYYEEGRIVDLDWSSYDGMTAVIAPEHLTPSQLQDGLVSAYRRWYGGRARAKRFVRQARHVSLRVAGAFAFSGQRFATGLDQVVGRPHRGFQPETADLDALVAVSRAPASEAITLATSQAAAGGIPVELGAARRPPISS